MNIFHTLRTDTWHLHALNSPLDLEELRNEAATLANMRHPNILQFFGVCFIGDQVTRERRRVIYSSTILVCVCVCVYMYIYG